MRTSRGSTCTSASAWRWGAASAASARPGRRPARTSTSRSGCAGRRSIRSRASADSGRRAFGRGGRRATGKARPASSPRRAYRSRAHVSVPRPCRFLTPRARPPEGRCGRLRELGHDVTILAPSSRAADLLAGRRALLDGASSEVIALGPAVPVSRRSRVGVPVGVRANLSLALAVGRYDVVHGFEPGVPSLSYLALRDAQALAVATFLSPDRLGYPPGRTQRERLLGRVDALVATSEETAEAAATRFPGDYTVVSPGVDL